MTGDARGATALFDRYAAEREAAHDPNVPYQRATWLWQTGTRREAALRWIAWRGRSAHAVA